MPTTPVAPTALPTPPNPADRATFNARAYPWSVALDPYGTQVTAVGTVSYNNAVESAASASAATLSVASATSSAQSAANSAVEASSYVGIAQSAANMVGEWSSLTGALSKPASVLHSTRVWALINNLADVTLSQPGVTSDWFDVTPAESAYICNHDQAVIPLPTIGTNWQVTDVTSVDADRELLLLASPATGIAAVCYNNKTKQYGATVLVRTTASWASPKSTLITTDRVLVVGSVTTAFEAVVLSLTGTSISVGVATTATIPESVTQITTKPLKVNSSFVVPLGCAANQRCIAITVSGTSPAIGTSVISGAGSGRLLVLPISASSFIAIGYGGSTVFAMPTSVSGTTLTNGTAATTTGSLLTTAIALSTGRFSLIYTNTATIGAVVSVAGTVATMTTVALGTGASLNQGGVKIGDQLVVATEASKVNVLTDVSGTATAGTPVTSPTALSYGGACGYGVDYVAFATASTTSTGYSIIKISGNNPVVYEYSSANIGITATDGSSSFYGYPNNILSANGKSGVIPPQISGTLGGTSVLQFGPSGSFVKVKLQPFVPNFIKKSDSVGFSAVQNSSVALTIRVHRLEMV